MGCVAVTEHDPGAERPDPTTTAKSATVHLVEQEAGACARSGRERMGGGSEAAA